MTLVYLAVTSWADFEADWGELLSRLQEEAWLTDEDGNRYLPRNRFVFTENLRIDFDYMAHLFNPQPTFDADGNVTDPGVDRGPHVNIQMTTKPGGDPIVADRVLRRLLTYLRTRPERDSATQGLGARHGAKERTLPAQSRVFVREVQTPEGTETRFTPLTPKRVFL